MFGMKFEDDVSLPEGITETGGTGSVEVRPGQASAVTIHRTVHHFTPFRPRPGPTHRVDGTVLHLDTNQGTKFPFFVAVDYVVDAPAGVRVFGGLSSGRFRLADVSTVDVKTSSGSIALTGATGDVTAKSSSGSITGQGMHSARIDAATTSGRLFLDLAEPADVHAQASSGSIALTVPDSHYRVDTKVSTGRTRIDVPNVPSGPHHLDLHTTSGSITVTRR
jgi:putative adhesin